MIEAITSPEQIDEIKSWYKKHKIILNYDILPKFGYTVSNVAAGYMFFTTDGKAIIEGIITNPDASITDRSNAVSSILNALSDTAKMAGCKYIFGLSDTKSVIIRAGKLGFSDIGSYNLLFKEC
jgi:hypothetical protein